MGRTAFLIVLSTLAAAGPAFAAGTTAPHATGPAPAAQPAAQPAPPPAPEPDVTAPGAEAITLLCKGTYYIQNTGTTPNSAPATTTTQATQFTVKLSYASQYMDLIASEWPALRAAKENPAVIRSIKFSYDDDAVRAMFVPATGAEVKGTLFNMGLSKLAGDYKEVITINRKTGDFTYPNTTGHCDKVEAKVKENKF